MRKVRRDLPDVGICEVLEDTLRNVDPPFGTSRTSVLPQSVSSSQTVRKAPSISLRAKEGGDERGAYLNFGNKRFSTVYIPSVPSLEMRSSGRQAHLVHSQLSWSL